MKTMGVRTTHFLMKTSRGLNPLFSRGFATAHMICLTFTTPNPSNAVAVLEFSRFLLRLLATNLLLGSCHCRCLTDDDLFEKAMTREHGFVAFLWLSAKYT